MAERPILFNTERVCQMLEGDYYADTPLGAVLAAMEGEKDGHD